MPKPGVLSRASTKDTPSNFRTVIPSATRRLKRSFASASENGAAHQVISTSTVFLCLPLTHFAPKTAVAGEFQSDPWLSMGYTFVMYVNRPSDTTVQNLTSQRFSTAYDILLHVTKSGNQTAKPELCNMIIDEQEYIKSLPITCVSVHTGYRPVVTAQLTVQL